MHSAARSQQVAQQGRRKCSSRQQAHLGSGTAVGWRQKGAGQAAFAVADLQG